MKHVCVAYMAFTVFCGALSFAACASHSFAATSIIRCLGKFEMSDRFALCLSC